MVAYSYRIQNKSEINFMKLPLLIFAMMIGIFSSAQSKITPAEAKDHIGDTVEITGKVFGIRFLENAKNTLLSST